MNLIHQELLHLPVNAVLASCFGSSKNFIKPSNYGDTIPAIIGSEDPIFVGFCPGENTPVTRSKFPMPKDASQFLVTSYVEHLDGTIFGLVSF